MSLGDAGGGDAALAIAMLAAFALLCVGARLAMTKAAAGDRQRGLLMIAAALVLVLNVLIWSL